MSRKMYWALNSVWWLVMCGALQCFYLYESHEFNYRYHYKAHDIWLSSFVIAVFSALLYYVLIEATGNFPKRKSK